MIHFQVSVAQSDLRGALSFLLDVGDLTVPMRPLWGAGWSCTCFLTLTTTLQRRGRKSSMKPRTYWQTMIITKAERHRLWDTHRSPILRDHRHHRITKQVNEGVAELKEPNYFLAQRGSKQNGGGSKDC